MKMTKTFETSVLIVGGGPVGHALAHDLGRRGVDCLLVEQNGPRTDHPKASAINARSMEFMRRWGLADEVRAAAAPEGFPHTALYCTSLNGFEIARIERPGHGGKAPAQDSPERAQRCNQLWLDPILRKHAVDHASVRILYHCRFDRLEERTSDVLAHATLLDGEEPVSISAQYVVDCSGGHSPIKRAFGIEWEGAEQIGYHVSIFMRAPELWTYHDKGRAALITFVDERGAWRNLVLLDGRELYRLGIRDKAAYDDPDSIDKEAIFRKAMGRDDVPHEFISTARWVARNVVSAGYHRGRVFMAGDAAHLNHPASGIGLNTGLGDIWDIGWKLQAKLAGWGGSALLDSYEIERRAVGLRNVGNAQASHANDRAFYSPTRDGRDRHLEATQEIHHRRPCPRIPLCRVAYRLQRRHCRTGE
jgi:2-polyprenyl-6-methoxyphenol hydroxylase-like FAD-dependent oxidoreductase